MPIFLSLDFEGLRCSFLSCSEGALCTCDNSNAQLSRSDFWGDMEYSSIGMRWFEDEGSTFGKVYAKDVLKKNGNEKEYKVCVYCEHSLLSGYDDCQK